MQHVEECFIFRTEILQGLNVSENNSSFQKDTKQEHEHQTETNHRFMTASASQGARREMKRAMAIHLGVLAGVSINADVILV